MEENGLIVKDIEKLRRLAIALFEDYSNSRGVFEKVSFPPEYNLPNGMEKGGEDHLRYLTLTVALDYMRDAEELWKQSHDAWTDLKTKWIFSPKQIVKKCPESLIDFLKKAKDRFPTKDARIWHVLCKTLLKFDDSVLKFLKYFDFASPLATLEIKALLYLPVASKSLVSCLILLVGGCSKWNASSFGKTSGECIKIYRKIARKNSLRFAKPYV